MATINPTVITEAGVSVTFAAASSGGDTVKAASGRRVTFHVNNASAASVDVTFAAKVKCSNGFLHDVTVPCAVGNTEVEVPARCVDPSALTIAVSYSATSSVTVAATML